jgi:transcriptional regulator with XRE-family HTH domain
VADQEKFFRALGTRLRQVREAHGYSQEDMISLGFSARHWQMVEHGRPITMTTLLRICEVFGTTVSKLIRGLDSGIYDPKPELPANRRGGRRRD